MMKETAKDRPNPKSIEFHVKKGLTVKETKLKISKSNSSFIRNKHNVHFYLHKLRDESDIRNFDDKWAIFVKVCKQYNVDVMEY